VGMGGKQEYKGCCNAQKVFFHITWIRLRVYFINVNITALLLREFAFSNDLASLLTKIWSMDGMKCLSLHLKNNLR
ncbi:MAG: hypothetical protein K2K69_04510, partial [Muribaculaceae bacterium]|nr:hypothetical protein [Muribaculaceae bacterium]